MLGYKTGASDSPEASKAMAKHLLTQTLPIEKAGLAAYYMVPGTPRPEQQKADYSQTSANVRPDTNPELASKLGIDPLQPLTEEQFANLLNGKRADGADIPGKIKRKSTEPLSELLKLDPESRPNREQVAHILAGRAADGSTLSGLSATNAPKRFLRKFGVKSGKPTKDQTENLLAGKMANGQELTWHDYKARVDSSSTRLSYVDLCFSAPKSFSIAWARATTESERSILNQCFSDAADELMEHIAKQIGQARKGDGAKGGYTQGSLTWIACDHYASRPTLEVIQKDSRGKEYTEILTVKGTGGRIAGDPQRHRHYAVLNTVMAGDGRMVGLDLQRLEDNVKVYGALGQAFLARNLRKHGVEVKLDRKHGLAYLPAIPQWICDAYSKRTNNGTEAAREYAKSQGLDWDTLGADHQKHLLKLGVQGDPRQPKTDDLSDWEAWDAQDQRLGYEHKSVLNAGAPVLPMDSELVRKTALTMLDEQLQKRADISGGDLRLAAIQGHIEGGLNVEADVTATLKGMRDQGVTQNGKETNLIWGTVTVKGRERIRATTGLHETQELRLIALAQEGWKDKSGALKIEQIETEVARYEALPRDKGGLQFDTDHGKSQRKGMNAIGTGGKVAILIGVAGSGKTTLLKPLVRAWKAEGRQVHGIALAWRQADNLTGAGVPGKHASAIAKFMHPKVQEQMKLGPKSVVVVDEVGLLGTRELLTLLELRKEKGFTLVMLGDPKQCQSLEAGPVIRLLERALGEEAVPRILTTVRQKTDREKEIVTLFRNGKADEALTEKMKDGHVHIVPGDYRTATRKVAELWQQLQDTNRGRVGYTLSISTPTNADARAISLDIRDKCKQRGLLQGKTVSLDAIDQRGETYTLDVAVGDKLRLFKTTRASFGNGLSGGIGRNASIVDVVGIRENGLVLRNEHGTEGLVTWNGLRHKDSGRLYINYGYVLTTFASQSSTVTDHIHAMPSGTKGVQGFEAYTSGTRHVETSHIVTSDGAERRDIARNRPTGDPRPVREYDVLENMGRNLSRQPEKVSALAMLEKAKDIRRGFARALQNGLRRGEQREKEGLAPTTLEQTFAQRREEEQVQAVVQQVTDMVQEQSAALKALEGMSKEIEDQVNRAIEDVMQAVQEEREPDLEAKDIGPAPTGPGEETGPPAADEVETEQEPVAVEVAEEAPPVALAETAARNPAATRISPEIKPSKPTFKEDPVIQFGTALREAGLRIDGEPVMDGKRRYVPVIGDKGTAKSGSYVGFLDGWPAGHIKNFKDDTRSRNWKADGVQSKRLPEEIEADRRATAEARRARDEDFRRIQANAAALGVSLWEKAKPAKTHPYLADKGVGAHGIRVGAKGQVLPVKTKDGRTWEVNLHGTLLIPMRDKDGALQNLQMVSTTSKRFLADGRKTGLFTTLGEVKDGGPLLVAEGYATAATLHEATGRPVVVAFDAGNLMPVCKTLAENESWRELVICADNDCHLPLRSPPLPNTGLEKANHAADETGAVVLLSPEIPERTAKGKGTDWNDYAKEEGLEAVRSLAMPVIQRERRPQLGRDEGVELEE